MKERMFNSMGTLKDFAWAVTATLVFFLPFSKTIVEACSVILIVSVVLKAILNRGMNQAAGITKDPILLALAIFLIMIAFSILGSQLFWEKTLKAFVMKWGKWVFLFYAIVNFLKKSDVEKLWYVFLVSTTIITADGLCQFFLGKDIISGHNIIRGTGIMTGKGFSSLTATFDHYNSYAAYLSVVYFFVLAFLMESRSKLIRSSALCLIGLIVFNLYFTHSRGGWLSFIVGNIMFVILRLKKHQSIRYIIFLVAMFIFLIFSVPSLRMRFIDIFIHGGDADRFGLWAASFKMFLKSPIWGVGLGTFMSRIQDYIPGANPSYAHNCYLQMLVETGLLGFSSFTAFLYLLLRRTWVAMNLGTHPLVIYLFSATIAYLFHAFFDTHFYSLRLAALFWIMTAFLYVLTVPLRKEEFCEH